MPILPLIVATGMVLLTVSIQILGLALLIWLMRWRGRRIANFTYFAQQAGVILSVVMGLFFMHTLQIWLYAVLFMAVGAIGSLEEAVYFSTASFTTVGYGDVLLQSPWRVVAAIESANGFLLLGWSTVFLLNVVSRLRSVEMEWLEGRSEPDLFNRRGLDE